MSKKIYCLTEASAYQLCGNKDLNGGGERWFEDFISLLKKMNYTVKVFQFSYERFTKKWRGHTITGLGNVKNKVNPTLDYKAGLDEFHAIAEKDNADGIFYLSMNLASMSIKIPNITVSHGIMLDRCEKDPLMDGIKSLELLKRWIRNAHYTISVDTNTIKTQAIYYPDNIKKMSYIPNYVDINIFTEYKKPDDGMFTVLYPRRLDIARGYRQTMKSCEILLEKYNNMEFIFCGKGNDSEEKEFETWYNNFKYKDRVKHFSLKPNEMYKSYRMANCVVIPTLYSEGTSLSLLESLATGVPTIATCVGGLTDLIQPNVNGLMIMPNNVEALTQAIEYIYNNPEYSEEMRTAGLNMVKHFSKDIWEQRISEVVKKIYGDSNE